MMWLKCVGFAFDKALFRAYSFAELHFKLQIAVKFGKNFQQFEVFQNKDLNDILKNMAKCLLCKF